MKRSHLNWGLFAIVMVLALYAAIRGPTFVWGVNNALALFGFGQWGTLEERAEGNRGRLLLRSGDLPAAEEALSRSIRIDPHSEFVRDYAFLLAAKGQLPEAEAKIRQHLENDRADGYGYLILTDILAREGRAPAELVEVLQVGSEFVTKRMKELEGLTGDPSTQAQLKNRAQVDELIGQLDQMERVRLSILARAEKTGTSTPTADP